MSPQLPDPRRTPSRLRSRPRRCALSVSPALPRRVVACSDVDGAPHVAFVPRRRHTIQAPMLSWSWSGALGEPTPLAVLLVAYGSGCVWDLDAADRAAARVELYNWPCPAWTTAPVVRYVGRKRTEPLPLRQVGVAGDLAAALATLADAPRWVGAAERLERVRELVESAAGLTRRALRDALGVDP